MLALRQEFNIADGERVVQALQRISQEEAAQILREGGVANIGPWRGQAPPDMRKDIVERIMVALKNGKPHETKHNTIVGSANGQTIHIKYADYIDPVTGKGDSTRRRIVQAFVPRRP